MPSGLFKEDFGSIAGQFGFSGGPPWIGLKIVGPSFKDITTLAYSLETRNNGIDQGPARADDFYSGRLLVLEGKVFDETADIPGDGNLSKSSEPYRLSFTRVLLDLNLGVKQDTFKFNPGELRGYEYDSTLSVYLASPRWTTDKLWASDGNTVNIGRLVVLGNHYQRDGVQQVLTQYRLR